jgi:hypothetical protein
VKDAPFKVLAFNGDTLARLSYSTESSANLLRYNGAIVTRNGQPVNWVRDVHQDFKITVNLFTLNGQDNFTTSLAILFPGDTVYTTVVGPVPFMNTSARTVSKLGYILTGIDAGIVAADKFRMARLEDIPPQ